MLFISTKTLGRNFQRKHYWLNKLHPS